MARPTNWSKELEQEAWDYVRDGWKEEGHAIPSVVGLCQVIDRARSVLYKWAEDENKGFKDILDYCNESQQLTLVNGSLKNELNANISKLVLGKHGYQEKQEVSQDITSGGKPVNNWAVNPVTTQKDG